MKRIALLILFLSASLFANETDIVDVNIKGDTYSIIIPDNLRSEYINAMTAYIEEMLDFEDLEKAYDEYEESAEKTIVSKDELIKAKNEEIAFKEKQIKELKQGKVFSIIPSVYYGTGINGHEVGAGVGVILFDSLYGGVQAGYPFELRFGLGWKF